MDARVFLGVVVDPLCESLCVISDLAERSHFLDVMAYPMFIPFATTNADELLENARGSVMSVIHHRIRVLAGFSVIHQRIKVLAGFGGQIFVMVLLLANHAKSRTVAIDVFRRNH